MTKLVEMIKSMPALVLALGLLKVLCISITALVDLIL